MKNKITSLIIFVFLLCTAIFIYVFLWPREYNVLRLQKRADTKYWNLSTGSNIGYTLIPAKGSKKPYPLIYLHGGPGAGITNLEIERLAPLAEKGYDVYLYDQVGAGHSNRLENINEYTAGRHKRDLEEIVQKINSEKVILIAQSWGSILAVLFLADNAGKVAQIAITAPAPIQPDRKELANIHSPDSLHLRDPVYSSRQRNLKAHNLRARAMMYCMRNFGRKLAPDKEADAYSTYLTNDLNKTMVCDTAKAVKAEGTEGFYVHYMTVMSLGKLQDVRPKIKNSPVPVLIMKGQCDNQEWGYTTEYLELFPNHQLAVIPGAGHNIFIEQPGLYVQTILEFLKKLPVH